MLGKQRDWITPTCLLIVTFNFFLLSYPSVFRLITEDTTKQYWIGTFVLFFLNMGLITLWPWRRGDEVQNDRREVKYAILAGVIGFLIILTSGMRLLHIIKTIPIDPYRADMLPQIQEGIRTLLSGHNPYRAYHNIAPWEIRFVYGPGLWVSYLLPYGLGIDFRFLTGLCSLFIPTMICLLAVLWAYRGFLLNSCLLLLMALVFSHNLAFLNFISVGHTQVYWPWIALFCLSFYQRNHYISTLLLALLLISRTTMIAVAPVYFIYLYRHHFRQLGWHLLLFILAVLLPFLPFLLMDARTLLYNMFTYYTTVLVHYAWNNPDVIFNTFGFTSILVYFHLTPYLLGFQILLLLGIYGYTFWLVKEKSEFLLAMSEALLVFCMTTIWPVFYVFFDVFLFFTFSILFAIRSPRDSHRSVEPHSL